MSNPRSLDAAFARPLSRRRVLQSGAAAGLAASAFGLAGLGAGATPIGKTKEGAKPKSGGTWTIAIVEEPDTLDPHKTGAAVSDTILGNVFDSLIAKDLNGKYVPGLASKWTISPDGLTLDFTLRTDVKFHDGTPFNAAAVKFSFDRILDPATKAVTSLSNLGPVDSVTVTGDNTFRLKMKQPFAPLLDGLADGGTVAMVSPDAVKKAGADFGRKPVGTGPFMVDEWRSGDRIVLKKNPDYKWAPGFLHQGGPAYLDSLVYRLIVEEASRTAAFDAGEVNQIGVPSADVSRYKEDDQYWTIDYLRKGVVFLEFNVTKPPFNDIQLRKALNYAIDKKTVLNAADQGLADPAYGLLSPSIWGYWPGIVDYAPHYDKDKAGQILDAAGYKLNGKNREKDGKQLKFTVYNLKNDAWDRGVQVIQSQLKDVGIQMEIQDFEFGTLMEKCKAGEQTAEMMGYTYTNPDIAFVWFHSSNIGTGLNFSHLNDPKLDALIVKGRTTMDDKARAQVYQEIQKYLVDVAVWVPLWIDKYTTAYDNKIQGAKFHPDAYTIYFDAWIS